MLLVDRDHETAGVRLAALLRRCGPNRAELIDRLREHGRHPFAFETERGAQPHRGLVPRAARPGTTPTARRRRPWSTPSRRRRVGSTRAVRRRRRGVRRRTRRCSRRARVRLRRSRRTGRTGSVTASLRNGVPESESRRWAWTKALRMPSPHAFSWPAWWTSSRITNPSADSPANLDAAAPVATCWYVVTSPCTSRASPSPGDQFGSSWSPSRCAASDHWVLRWLVGCDDDQRSGLVGERGSRARERERRLPGPRRGDGEEVVLDRAVGRIGCLHLR